MTPLPNYHHHLSERKSRLSFVLYGEVAEIYTHMRPPTLIYPALEVARISLALALINRCAAGTRINARGHVYEDVGELFDHEMHSIRRGTDGPRTRAWEAADEETVERSRVRVDMICCEPVRALNKAPNLHFLAPSIMHGESRRARLSTCVSIA